MSNLLEPILSIEINLSQLNVKASSWRGQIIRIERESTIDRPFDRRPEQRERTRIAGIRYALSSRDLSAQFHGSFGKNGKISPLSVAATSVGNRSRYSPAVDSLTRPWRTRGLKRSFQSYVSMLAFKSYKQFKFQRVIIKDYSLIQLQWCNLNRSKKLHTRNSIS